MSLLVSVCWAPLITLQMYQLPPSYCAISKSLYFRETVKEHKNPRKATASSDGIGSIHCCPAQSGTAGFHPQHTHPAYTSTINPSKVAVFLNAKPL